MANTLNSLTINDKVYDSIIDNNARSDIQDIKDNMLYRPNLLINGDFQIWQKGTASTILNSKFLKKLKLKYLLGI